MIYNFSALASGQLISFNPGTDVLNFDQSSLSAANVRVVAEGTAVRISLVGVFPPKDIVLQNTTPQQLATSNTTFANGSALLFGDNAVATANDDLANTLTGTGGNDLLQGFGGADTMVGGLGNDTYIVSTGDVLSDTGGIDTVVSDVSWVLGAAFENLTLTGSAARADGNNLANVITGNDAANFINGRAGDDTVLGMGGNDSIDMSTGGTGLVGNRHIDGGAGTDQVDYDGYATSAVTADLGAGTVTGGGTNGTGSATLTSIERLITGAFDDSITGGTVSEYLDGRDGNDTVNGGAGNDTVLGGAGDDVLAGGAGNDTITTGPGADAIAFAVAPGAANADTITDFSPVSDKIRLDGTAYTAIGASGDFVTGDVRFFAGAGATSGHDADDRVIYNTTTGQLYYDADGSGAGASQLVATLMGAPAIGVTHIAVDNGAGAPPPPPPPSVIHGTTGNDSILGTSGNDTIDGGAGDDTLNGWTGNDSVIGGAGNDSIVGIDGQDTFIGGDGNDTLDGRNSAFGGNDAEVDTFDGGLGDDTFILDNPADVVSDAGGADTIVAVNMGWTLGAGFENLVINNGEAEGQATGIGNELDNVLGAEGQGNHLQLEGRGGNDTLFGSFQDDTLLGGDGNDSIDGGDDVDFVDGGAGNDTLSGGEDFQDDVLTGGAGADSFVLMSRLGSLADRVQDFAPGLDKLRLDGATFANVGPSGNYASGDGRFFAAAGATGAHDATDRLIYDTTTGDVYYDRDGVGGAAAEHVATLQGAPVLAATDVEVINGTAGGLGTTGTAGDDSLRGSAGADTIEGAAGNDTLDGLAGGDRLDGSSGNDSLMGGSDGDFLLGGDGNDTLDGDGGGEGVQPRTNWALDTMDGGLGDDTYLVSPGDQITDAGGIDSVFAEGSWTLGAGLENLFIVGTEADRSTGTGNELDNIIDARVEGATLFGRGGNDSLSGTNRIDSLFGDEGNDTLDGGGSFDTMHGGDGDDRLTGAGFLYGESGNDSLLVTHDDGRLEGGAGADTLTGGDFADRLDGGVGRDVLSGGGGDDGYVFSASPAPANADTIAGFASGSDAIALDANAFTSIGAAGGFAAADQRFFAAAGATAAHDASDRVIYNTTTGDLYYDQDGSGAGTAVLFATIEGAPALAASDLTVINAVAAPTPTSTGVVTHYELSSDPEINAVLNGQEKWGTGGTGTGATVTYSFRTDASVYSYSFDPGQAGWQPWSEQDKGFLRDALQAWADVADIRFVEVEDSATVAGDLRFGPTTVNRADGALAWAYYPAATASAGDMWFGNVFRSLDADLSPGTRGFEVALHEIGHALGLKHSFEAPNAIADPLRGTAAYTVMSEGGFNFVEGFNLYPDMPMLFDVAAVQHIYGANMATHGGDDVYSWGVGEPIFDTLWDAGGNDTIDWSNQSTSALIDLNAGHWSEIGPLRGEGPPAARNLMIAYDATIENANGGSGGDFLIGNTAGNLLSGGAGSDELDGGAGSDTLTGGTGADGFLFTQTPGTGTVDHISDFVSGADRVMLDTTAMTALGAAGDFSVGDARFHAAAGAMSGHDADDRVVYDSSTGRLFYDADGNGAGAAQLIAVFDGAPALAASDITAGLVRTFDAGAGGDDSILGTAGQDVIRGFTGNDTLDGAAGNDTLEGGDGNDMLIGGTGVDTLNGGLGDDIYVVSTGARQAPDAIVDSGGVDTVRASGTWTLTDGLENLDISRIDGIGDTAAVGNSLDNVIRRVGTVEGRIVFDGGDGNDTMVGGAALDDFVFKSGSGNYGNDFIDGGEDIDTISLLDGFQDISVARSAVIIDLGAGTLSGGGNGGSGSATFVNIENASGGMFDDVLIAHDGHTVFTNGQTQTVGSVLRGGQGNDTLIGGAISDGLIGGEGADTFVLRHAPTAGFTYDFIIDFLAGTDKIRLDAAAMPALGAAGNFAAGDARFFAAAGAFSGHDADDRIIYDTSDGWLYYDADGSGSGASLRLAGLGSNSALAATDIAVDNGTVTPPPPPPSGPTAGNDSLAGTAGADTIDGLAGNDTIDGLAGNDSLLGGEGLDSLSGGDGNDVLDGGTGIDTMAGGLGNDTYVVTAGDVVSDAGGIDTIVSDASWTLGADFENLTFTGTASARADGNNLNNLITGNDAANFINGRAGDDTIFGMGGNDSIDMSTGGTGSVGNRHIDGGAGTDQVDYDGYATSALTANLGTGTVTGGGTNGTGSATLTSIERLIAGSFNDSITGGNASEYLDGRGGNDTVNGGLGNDTLLGGAGNDSFLFNTAPSASNVDSVEGFVSATDKLDFDDAVFTAMGAAGNFAAGDARFFAGAGASAGHDADDRLIYNTTTGALYYDADGSGTGAAQQVATIAGHPALAATDLAVV